MNLNSFAISRFPARPVALLALAALAVTAHGTPPNLTANNGATVTQTQSVVITTQMLNAADLHADGTPAEPDDIVFEINARDPVTNNGTLELFRSLAWTPVQPGEDITLRMIQDGRLRYRAAIADQLFDDFLFRLRDADGNYAVILGMPAGTPYNFRITIVQLNTRPIAGSGSGSLGLGGTFDGTLVATDHDRPAQALTYSIVSPPASGSVQLLDPNTGAFRYTAALGFSGQVSFTYQVTDGALTSLSPGTVTLTVANQPPAVTDASFAIPQNRPFTGTINASDPDLPKQALTFAVAQAPEKGSVTVAADGTFRYTPAPGRFGEDSFRITANDGSLTSAAATIRLEIEHVPVAGDIFLATQSRNQDGSRSVLVAVIDPDQFDLSGKAEGGLLTSLRSLAFSPWNRRLYVIEGNPGEPQSIVEIDPVSGAQRIAFASEILQFPLGLAASEDGYLYISNAPLVMNEPVDHSLPGSQILRVDLRDGTHEVLIEKGQLHFPTGLCFGPDGALYILDAEMLAFGHPAPPADATILRFDLTTQTISQVADGGLLQDPFALLALADGSFLVTELRGDILKIAANGTQSHVYDPEDGERIVTAITRDENGVVYATATPFGGSEAVGAILRIEDPEAANATAAVFLEGDFLGEPWGIAAAVDHANLSSWRTGYFGAAVVADPAQEATVWGDAADADGDGLPNLLEFALNLSPVSPDSGAGVLAPYLQSDGGVERLTLTVSRRLGTDVDLVLEASSDLVTWETIGGPIASSASGTTVTFSDNTALDAAAPRFIRLRVSRP